MKVLEDKIRQEGIVKKGDVLKVDDFLNHQVDVELMEELGKEFARYFKDRGITKVVTIESSGIAPATFAAKYLHTKMIFIKKAMPSTMNDPAISTVFSYTKNKEYTICMEKKYLTPEDKILFIDDFLANGEAFKGATHLIKQTGATIEGVGIVIEKSHQAGAKWIREQGYDIYSLARIASMSEDGTIEFIEE